MIEAFADGLSHQEAGVDALEDDRELVRGERFVEVELAHVPSRLLCVPLDNCVTREESRVGGDRRSDVAGLRIVAHVVEQVQTEVGEGVAECGHLPVEHGDYATGIGRRQHRVVESVVAVDDRRRG